MKDTDLAYIAGLFDGEGCISYKQYMRQRRHQEKAYLTWNIRMEMSMTDQSILRWVHEVLGVGTIGKRKNGRGSLGKKQQWRWRCQFRDAFYVCCALFPYAHVKLDKIQKIIDHYSDRKLKVLNDKVVSLDEYKQYMSLQ